MMPTMPTITAFLDLTRDPRGAAETAASWPLSDGPLVVLTADPESAECAAVLQRSDPRLQVRRCGSGTGVCDWLGAVRDAATPYVVFLRPGDRLRGEALAIWRRGLTTRDGAAWVLAAAEPAPYNDWWFQRDLSESAAALIATGAAFSDCTALVQRAAWLHAATVCPEIAVDGSRAAGWLALALTARPALVAEVVADAGPRPTAIDAEMLAQLLHGLARREPGRTGALMADIGRIAAGLRLAQDTLFEAIAGAGRCFGEVPRVRMDPSAWLRRTRFFEGLFARGDRPVWIWGAGQLGLTAAAWLRERGIPVAGFLDRDARRDGTSWGGICVRHATTTTTGPARLIVVASMYHSAIAADLEARGGREGHEFVIFEAEVPWLAGDAA